MLARLFALLLCLCLFPPAHAQETHVTRFAADFDYVRQLAPDAVAWLYQEGTGISQPVVYSADETYYLRHGYHGRYSGRGAIYLTGEAPIDLSERVITLRGRNCMDYSLFGSLSEYRNAEYYQQHPCFWLITPDGCERLDVFAGLKRKHSDRESWAVSPEDDLTGERLSAILEDSFLTPNPDLLPEEGDAWAVLTTESADGSGNRYVLYARRRPVPETGEPAPMIYEYDMDSRETYAGRADAAGVGSWMLYAQNDPSWNRLIFETPSSSRHRIFGDGGCGPTAVAIAIANLVPKEDLPKIRDYASDPLGYVFCTCCIGSSQCDREHVPYQLNTPEQYLRYFPLAVADFAMGNNTLGVQGRRDSYGTNMSYLDAICGIYGIQVARERALEDVLPALREGDTMVVCCVSGSYTPFTRNSHFLVLAGATDEYLYVIDPLRRETYERDTQGILEVLTPGLVRVKIADAPICHFSTFHLLSRGEA